MRRKGMYIQHIREEGNRCRQAYISTGRRMGCPHQIFDATDRQWVLLLAMTLGQRDEAIRQRDEARQEAEASRWKEVSARQQATFWKTQHRRARARAEAARNELKRLKSVSSVNELKREAGRLRHELESNTFFDDARRQLDDLRGAAVQAVAVLAASRLGGLRRQPCRWTTTLPSAPCAARLLGASSRSARSARRARN